MKKWIVLSLLLAACTETTPPPVKPACESCQETKQQWDSCRAKCFKEMGLSDTPNDYSDEFDNCLEECSKAVREDYQKHCKDCE
jgi:hypothetical protein